MDKKKGVGLFIATILVISVFAAFPMTATAKYVSSEHSAPSSITTTVTEKAMPKLTSGTIVQELETITFPAGTYVIPMDDKQNDIIRAFGFFANVLQNATINRIIEPPDVTMETSSYPAGTTYSGGPVLVMASDAAAIASAHAAFPSVTVDTLTDSFTSDSVFMVSSPTRILVIQGIWGHTEDVLDSMEIPYTLTSTSAVESDPGMLLNYDLVVDDCPGWWGSPPAAVMDNMRELANRGGEIIYTDIALLDLATVFPGYTTVVSNVDGAWNCTVHNPPVGLTEGEFPSQYNGSVNVSFYTMGGGNIFSAVDPSVSVILDSQNYAGQYRILAAYFNYGDGIVEGFAYHPPEQTEAYTDDRNSYNASCILYGNKFVHAAKPPPIPVPQLTPMGLLALFGMLMVFLAGWNRTIKKKR